MIKEKTKSIKLARHRVRQVILTEESELVARKLDKIHKGKKWLTEDVNEYLTRKYLNRTQIALRKIVIKEQIKQRQSEIKHTQYEKDKLKKELKKLTEEIIDF